MRSYLLVANQTLDSPALQQWARQAVADSPDGCHIHLVVPATRVPGVVVWTEGEARAAAERRLADALTKFASMGAKVDGEVGDEHPHIAATNALREGDYDAVVVSTLPATVSRWLKLDVVSRLRKESTVPVMHIEFDQQPATRA